MVYHFPTGKTREGFQVLDDWRDLEGVVSLRCLLCLLNLLYLQPLPERTRAMDIVDIVDL